MSIQSIEIKSGVNLHYIHTKKFKTTTLGFYFCRPLRREEATLNALLPNVLKRACPLFPESIGLSRHLDNLYGAKLHAGVRKKGDLQVIHINFEFINENYTGKSRPVLESIISLAESAILGQTSFSKEYVAQEKENLKQYIQSQINDKRSYAATRCAEIMCAAEPYGINEHGFINDVDAIDDNTLFTHYKSAFLSTPVEIFVCGDVDIFWVKQQIERIFSGVEPAGGKMPEMQIVKDVKEVKRVTETEQVAQGKLSLGFRTGIQPGDDAYPALLVYNAAFGGGPSSKLFNNVRERLSLAYYATSKIEMLKGLMMVNSGIEASDFDKAYDEIMAQHLAVQNGDISDDEMSAARLYTVNGIRSISDNAFMTEDYWLGRLIVGRLIELDELADCISKVTKEDVMKIARNTVLDTVYFLKGGEA
ncbi:MAG: Peptidase M16 inactive domain protein [Firmicutes bacterium ADurb.Bin193]|nr:MAG: Peptidase M16 inactive domain protein [Firmicutes bacterium ADurb.Bin193]